MTSHRTVCLTLPSDTADFLLKTAYDLEHRPWLTTHDGRYQYPNDNLHWSRLRRALQPADLTQKYGGK